MHQFGCEHEDRFLCQTECCIYFQIYIVTAAVEGRYPFKHPSSAKSTLQHQYPIHGQNQRNHRVDNVCQVRVPARSVLLACLFIYIAESAIP